jgi:hypothetical protein
MSSAACTVGWTVIVCHALLGFADVGNYTSNTRSPRSGDYIPLAETLVAYDTNNGKELWRINDESIDARTIGMLGQRIYYYARSKHLRAIESKSGKIIWDNGQADLMRAMASPLDPGGNIDGITLYRPGLLCTPEVIVLKSAKMIVLGFASFAFCAAKNEFQSLWLPCLLRVK